jgi:hypothetical protein
VLLALRFLQWVLDSGAASVFECVCRVAAGKGREVPVRCCPCDRVTCMLVAQPNVHIFACYSDTLYHKLKGKKYRKNATSKRAAQLEENEIIQMAQLHHHETTSLGYSTEQRCFHEQKGKK